jgi:hypothetical protein
MTNLTHFPLLVFAFCFLALWLAAWIGWSFLRRKSALDEELRQDFGFILAATLTLLGLIIGFSFSMAANRYNLRKINEALEANAIGTEYIRADLLPAADRDKVRALLRSYLEQRIAFYLAPDDRELQQVNTTTAALQNNLWSAVRVPAEANPTPVMALAVSGMNDVFNSQSYTQAEYWNRIPMAAWAFMAAIAIGCNLLVGYGSRSAAAGSKLLPILPLVVSTAFMLIAEIDAPRHGVVRVRPQNLTNLAESLRARSADHFPPRTGSHRALVTDKIPSLGEVAGRQLSSSYENGTSIPSHVVRCLPCRGLDHTTRRPGKESAETGQDPLQGRQEDLEAGAKSFPQSGQARKGSPAATRQTPKPNREGQKERTHPEDQGQRQNAGERQTGKRCIPTGVTTYARL